MAVTHGDLAPKRQDGLDVSSQKGLLLMVLSILCGFASFILCLAAEATRSEATWFELTKNQKEKTYECYYNGSGRTPLTCAVLAFLTLALAMFIEHAFILVTISGPKPPALVAWSLTESDLPASAASLRREACALFIATWVSFAVAEILLMIGISVEASHLSDWNGLRTSCVIARPGLFAAAGVFGLITVFLAAVLYLSALKAQRLHQTQLHGNRRHNPELVPNTSAAAAPPSAPPHSNVQHSQQQRQQCISAYMSGADHRVRLEFADLDKN